MHNEFLKRSRILILDDQESNILLLERMLKQAGYGESRSVQDPLQAVTAVLAYEPDLLLLDLMMPRMDGCAVIKQLGRVIPSNAFFPILVITADVSQGAKREALALGAKDFITKPIDCAEALSRIRNLLEMRWLYKELQSYNKFLTEQVSYCQHELAEATDSLRCATEPDGGTREHLQGLGEILGRALQNVSYIANAVQELTAVQSGEMLHPSTRLQRG